MREEPVPNFEKMLKKIEKTRGLLRINRTLRITLAPSGSDRAKAVIAHQCTTSANLTVA